ncbi:hypothetical protein LEMA_P100380.1 [Plenodomus lingam JN3]|uniref:Uncharacterized protein n=2 Tax=Leptosphaeria maculans TaxID=5022 RepID=E5A047_LEPMJ|nr:hypothetical protein LEMA_P100380.1 [Plenodomus lingam JN3]CBX96907.1 hypothetical protein LEMA_P100380.1 [Plenodomus lingam JN3]
MTLNGSSVREMQWTQTNGTRRLIRNLQLAQVQTLRTTHLTLGAFSLALALLTVHRIISDARRAAALKVTTRKQRLSALHNVHPAETFPLALACGAVLQQITFVAVQSTSLHSVLSNKCRGFSMVTLPAMFIIGYITLVFGAEMAWRAFGEERFAPRGKWNTAICIAVVLFMLLLTWLPTVIWPMFDRCFGGLIWFTMRYDLLILVVLCILVVALLTLAAVLSIQLMRSPRVDAHERISASRMTYFMIVTALIYILVIPVEIQSLRKDFMNALATARVAEISLFSSGMIITFFHLFLRTNAVRMVIRPVEEMKGPEKQKRPKIRFFGPSDLEMNISGPMSLQTTRRPESRQGLIDVGPEKNRFDIDPEYFARPERALSPLSARSGPTIDLTRWPLPPEPLETDNKVSSEERNKKSYSLFPTRAEDVPRLPATVYDPSSPQDNASVSKLAMRRFTRRSSVTNVTDAFDFLTKPRPFFGERHTRNPSTDSSATVQIGLRFSVAPATLAAAKTSKPEREADSITTDAPSLTRKVTDSSDSSLGLPIQLPSTTYTPEDRTPSPSVFPSPPPRDPSPTQPRANSPVRAPTSPLLPALNSGAYLQAQREKVLSIPQPSPKPAPRIITTTPPTISGSSGSSGLQMNPITPVTSASSSTPSSPDTPVSAPTNRLNTDRTAPSPTARIPLGAGTMSRSPPRNGWI